MNNFESIFLGIIQGITEFLPISSSGHLVILQDIMKTQNKGLFFEVSLHFGTLISILIVYFDDIKKMLLEIKNIIAKIAKNKFRISELNEYESLIFYIIIGSIPTALIGLGFENIIETIFNSSIFVGFMLLVTGMILYFTRKLYNQKKSYSNMTIVDALIIGIFQGFATIPGISRSGATIFAGLFRGLKRQKAIKYSFLLSIPAVFGANLLKIKDITIINMNMSTLLFGVLAAIISGYISIIALTKILNKGKLHLFSYYCWIIGGLIILKWLVF